MRRSKPAFLIELAIIGKIGFRHNPYQSAMIYNRGTVEKHIGSDNRNSDNEYNIKRTGEVQQAQHTFFCTVYKMPLHEKVLTRVACYRQFWKDHYLYPFVFCHGNLLFHVFKIAETISNTYCRNGRCHRDKSVFHIFFYLVLILILL